MCNFRYLSGILKISQEKSLTGINNMTAWVASRVITEANFWQRCCKARMAASSNSNNNSASCAKQPAIKIDASKHGHVKFFFKINIIILFMSSLTQEFRWP